MEQIQFLTGDADTLNELYRQKPYIPFAQQTIVFLDAFYRYRRRILLRWRSGAAGVICIIFGMIMRESGRE